MMSSRLMLQEMFCAPRRDDSPVERNTVRLGLDSPRKRSYALPAIAKGSATARRAEDVKGGATAGATRGHP